MKYREAALAIKPLINRVESQRITVVIHKNRDSWLCKALSKLVVIAHSFVVIYFVVKVLRTRRQA